MWKTVSSTKQQPNALCGHGQPSWKYFCHADTHLLSTSARQVSISCWPLQWKFTVILKELEPTSGREATPVQWYRTCLWPLSISCPTAVPSWLHAHSQPLCCTRSWNVSLRVSTALQELIHLSVTNIISILSPKHGTIPATRKKTVTAETRTNLCCIVAVVLPRIAAWPWSTIGKVFVT